MRLTHTCKGLLISQDTHCYVHRKLKKDAVPTVAYSDSFGESGEGNGTLGYYLASAFDQIYVQQNGLVSFTGRFYCYAHEAVDFMVQSGTAQH